MRKWAAIGLAMMALAGCRREDVRSFEEFYPQLTDVKMKALTKKLARYEGIKKDTVKLERGMLKMEYDSLQLAKENIRREVEECLK